MQPSKKPATKIKVLDDLAVVGRFTALRALRALQADAAQPDRAFTLIEAANKQAPHSATVRAARAVVLTGAGGLADGLEAARQALGLRDDAPRRTLLAQLLLTQGQVAEAEQHLRRALEEDPSFWPALLLRAMIASGKGKPARAKKDLKRALEIAPDEPSVLRTRSMTRRSAGDLDGAISDMERATKAEDNESSLLMLYELYLAKGDDEQAKRTRAKLDERAHKAPELSKLLQRIDQARQSSQAAAAPKIRLPDIKLTPPTRGGQLLQAPHLAPPPTP